MLRFLFRSLGLVLLVAAFGALIVDGTRSLSAGRALAFTAADTAGWLSPARFAAVQAFVETTGGPVRAALTLALGLPTTGVLALVGAIFLLLGRRPASRIGVSNRR